MRRARRYTGQPVRSPLRLVAVAAVSILLVADATARRERAPNTTVAAERAPPPADRPSSVRVDVQIGLVRVLRAWTELSRLLSFVVLGGPGWSFAICEVPIARLVARLARARAGRHVCVGQRRAEGVRVGHTVRTCSRHDPC